MPGIHASWLHALLKRAPGGLPRWLLSSSGCSPDGIDMVAGLLSGAVAFLVFLALGPIGQTLRTFIAIAVFVVIISLTLSPVERARTAERKARANQTGRGRITQLTSTACSQHKTGTLPTN
jgi:hypothetical protein